MEKTQLLEHIGVAAKAGTVTRLEVIGAFDAAVPQTLPVPEGHSRLPAVLYTVGGIIVLLGIIFFVGQHWEELGSIGRVLVTLGAGFGFFLSGVLLARTERLLRLSDAMHLLGGLLVPVGVFVLIDELGVIPHRFGLSEVYAILCAMYVTATVLYRRAILAFFALLFGSILCYALTGAVIDGVPELQGEYIGRLFAYLTVGVGAAYLVLGHALRRTVLRGLSVWLLGIGTIATLGAAMFLQGYQPSQYVFWELLFPGLVFGAFALAVRLRSTAMLIFSALYLVGFLVKMTFEYFSDSLDNAALLLVLFGFIVMGTGYLVYYLNRKYITTA